MTRQRRSRRPEMHEQQQSLAYVQAENPEENVPAARPPGNLQGLLKPPSSARGVVVDSHAQRTQNGTPPPVTDHTSWPASRASANEKAAEQQILAATGAGYVRVFNNPESKMQQDEALHIEDKSVSSGQQSMASKVSSGAMATSPFGQGSNEARRIKIQLQQLKKQTAVQLTATTSDNYIDQVSKAIAHWEEHMRNAPSCQKFILGNKRNMQQSSNQDFRYLFLNDRKTDEPWLLDLHCDKLSRELWGGAMSGKDGAYAAKGWITALATHLWGHLAEEKTVIVVTGKGILTGRRNHKEVKKMLGQLQQQGMVTSFWDDSKRGAIVVKLAKQAPRTVYGYRPHQ